MAFNYKRLALMAGLLIVYLAIDVTCPFLFLTKIECPCCGITRAWRSVLRGDIRTAFLYNPLFLLAPIIVILVCIDNPKKWISYIEIIIGTLFLGLFIYRLIF